MPARNRHQDAAALENAQPHGARARLQSDSTSHTITHDCPERRLDEQDWSNTKAAARKATRRRSPRKKSVAKRVTTQAKSIAERVQRVATGVVEQAREGVTTAVDATKEFVQEHT